MTQAGPPPLIAIGCCQRPANGGFVHGVRDRYIEALADGAGALPLLIPALCERLSIDHLLQRVDGLMLTGSPSNVDPSHYDGGEAIDKHLKDHARDGTTLPLIRAAIDMGMPVFGVCRGIQEINVALGGSLHQRVQDLDGCFDHRSNKTIPPDERFRPVHDIHLLEGGLLQEVAGPLQSHKVNSLHAQAIDRVADRLRVEARADDGTIEAVSLQEGKGFCLAIQWHPEFEVYNDPFNLALFEAFGDACRKWARKRNSVEAEHDRYGSLA